MIVSHLGLFFGLTAQWFHLYAMRPFAPMFLFLLGMLWRPGFRRRHWQFIGGLIAATLLATPIGFAFPNILVLMGASLIVLPLAVRWPYAAFAICLTQLALWPMPQWWTGYPPGFVLGLTLVGAVVPADNYVRTLGRLGSRFGFEVVGRWPLTFYLGHLGALYVIDTMT